MANCWTAFSLSGSVIHGMVLFPEHNNAGYIFCPFIMKDIVALTSLGATKDLSVVFVFVCNLLLKTRFSN